MFIALSEDEIVQPDGIWTEGTRYLKSVELFARAPWIVANFDRVDDGSTWDRVKLFPRHSDLVESLLSGREGRLTHVQRVSPPWMSASHRWEMETLVAIWAVPPPDGRPECAVYVFADEAGTETAWSAYMVTGIPEGGRVLLWDRRTLP
jgi:hypothetical protein